MIQRLKEAKNWFFEKINKTYKPLVKLTKINRERTQINKNRDEKGIAQQIPREFRESSGIFKNLIFLKMENLEEMDKFPDTYDLPKLNQVDINHLNRSIISNEIEAVKKCFPTKKSPEPDRFTTEFNQTFKVLKPMFLKLINKIEREGMLPNSFYKVSITLISQPDNYR
jgi:hypothetical protein